MRLKGLIVCLLGCLFALAGLAQTVTVTDQKGSAIENVYIFNTSKTVTELTNSRGQAQLDKFTDLDTLLFQHASFTLMVLTKRDLAGLDYKLKLYASIYNIGEVEIVTLRDRADPNPTPLTMTTIGAETVVLNNPQTSADMLQQSGDVLIQKSQMGGGSPILRGFEANKILMVVDGVRMNNAIYRSGHLQNAITVDNNMLESTEVLFGPGSVVYGSDALGGVIHFHSRLPQLATNDSNVFAVNAMTRYATANEEKSAHFDFNFGTQKLGFLTSVTASEFGDLRMGDNRTHGYDSLGKVYHYAVRQEGVDVMVLNDDPNLQVGTGYSQLDLMQKVMYQASDRTDLLLNVQYSTSSDVPRFDRLNDYVDGELRFAEWYYGPQNRLLTSLAAKLKDGKWYDKANIIAAYQRIDEDRIDRRFGRTARTYNFEDVQVYSLNTDFVKKVDTVSSWYYGAEFTHNDVVSTAKEYDISTGAEGPTQTRYPDGGSTMTTAAAYLKYQHMLSERAKLDLGTRYSYTILHSRFNDTTFLQLPFEEIKFSNGALTGSAALLWEPGTSWQVSTVAATAYRSPNVDDYGKVFEKNELVTVPNDQLRPEYAYSGEVGISKAFRKDDSDGIPRDVFTLSSTLYYTYLVDAIVRTEHSLNGEDSLLYDGSLARIVTNTNADEAQIYGLAVKATGALSEAWTYDASVNFTVGDDITNEVPLAHIPPVFGKAGLAWQNERWQNSFYALYNGWKDIEDYSPTGTDNEVEATADGSPSWFTLNLRSTFKISKVLSAQAAIENLLDHHYKPFASGLSAPGRNFIVALRASFGK